MKTKLTYKNKSLAFDLSEPIDVSLAIENSSNLIAWYLDPPKIQAVKQDNWTAKVSEGASINFNNIWFNPHAHGTHTECVGHISNHFYSINQCLKQFFFFAKVISLSAEKNGEDNLFTKSMLQEKIAPQETEALLVRSLPNSDLKKQKNYNNTNWPYFTKDAALYLRECGIKHLLTDLPSVDKEKDAGKVLAHKAFFNYPEQPRLNASITEFIFIPTTIKDGFYMLNLQIAAIENDASPSKPVLYKIENL